jgi:hypothetical protein
MELYQLVQKLLVWNAQAFLVFVSRLIPKKTRQIKKKERKQGRRRGEKGTKVERRIKPGRGR